MDMLLEQDIRPKLFGHVYWKDKEIFQMKEDTNELWVIFAVEDGSFSYEINDLKGTAAFGDLVFCPPGAVFRREVIKPLSFHFFILEWVDLIGQPVKLEEDASIPSGKITIKDTDRLSSTYTHLKKQIEIRGNPGRNPSMKMLNHLLSDLWYLYSEEFDDDFKSREETMIRDTMIDKAIHLIQEHAYSTLSLKQIATELGLTQVQFTRRFKKVTGTLPIDFLTSLRLHKVQKLLLESNLTLQQIANQCGYENEFYLSRVFTKRKKVAPSHFRKMHRL